MDDREMRAWGLPEPAAAAVDGYLSALDRWLPLGRRARAEIRDEIGDGLACAIAELIRGGHTPATAATAAIAELGAPRDLAAAFATQAAPATARRLGLALVATGPLVGLSWVVAYPSAGSWPARVDTVLAATPLLPFALAVAVPAALLAVASGGRSAWRLRVPDHLASGAALVAVAACLLGDASLLAAALAHGLVGSTAVVGMAVSALRLGAAAEAGRRLTRLRATRY